MSEICPVTIRHEFTSIWHFFSVSACLLDRLVVGDCEYLDSIIAVQVFQSLYVKVIEDTAKRRKPCGNQLSTVGYPVSKSHCDILQLYRYRFYGSQAKSMLHKNFYQLFDFQSAIYICRSTASDNVSDFL